MERTIQTPPTESLSSKEAADWIGIPEDAYLDLVRKGLIPKGAFVSHKTRRWPWEEVVATKLMLRHLLDQREKMMRAKQDVKSKTTEKVSDD